MTEEVELKFRLNDEASFDRWIQAEHVAGAYAVVPGSAETIEVVDKYLDTPDYRFLRHGYAVRHRQTDGHSLLSVKTLAASTGTDTGSLHRRLEVESPLTLPDAAPTPQRWPDGVQAHLAPLLDDILTLRCVAIIHQTRDKRMIADVSPTAETAASATTPPFKGELSVDSVAVRMPGTERVVAHYFELEVELLQGGVEHLRRLAADFDEQADLTPQTTSKYEDALQTLALCAPTDVADEEPWQAAGIRPEMHMAEAVRLIMAEQLLAMLLNEPGVRYRDDDMEHVHRMRVATRRARVALDAFAPFFKHKQIRFLDKRLRKTGKLLGVVRDLDVALYNAQLTAKHGDGVATADAHQELWREQRTHAQRALMAWLDSEKYARFIERFDRFVKSPGKGARIVRHVPGKRPVAQEVRHVVPTLLTAQFAAVCSYATLFAGEAEVDYATIHRLRIDAKYLRYELEFFRAVLGPSHRTLIKQLKKLQDHLGRLNDAAVTAARLGQDAKADADAQRYADEQRAIVRTLSAQTPQLLAHFCRQRNRRHLGSAIAAL